MWIKVKPPLVPGSEEGNHSALTDELASPSSGIHDFYRGVINIAINFQLECQELLSWTNWYSYEPSTFPSQMRSSQVGL